MRLRTILHTNWTATLRLNYNAGGLRACMRLPIKVYGPLRLTLNGKIVLPKGVTRNMVVINDEYEDYIASAGKAEVRVDGEWHMDGFLRMGPDCAVVVEKGAVLRTGKDTYIGRDSQIHCRHSVSIGDGVFAGEMYVCDSTMHQICDGGVEKEALGQVTVHDGTYLGFRTMLLKGCVIPPRSVVGSGAVCCRDYTLTAKDEAFICGVPAEVKREHVTARL